MDVFDLVAKITLDDSDYKKKISTVGSRLKKMAKTAGVALAAASSAAIKVTKDAVNAYGEYEQLVGGINKLFGDGAKQLIAYADQAYETAGMSANEYMQNVTGFSAALINSLGGDTQKAVELADMAMRDISDNANTFGKYTAQELANVYQALAKGQYQTLDNLNLGFGGTKEGMEQLIRKAEELDSSFTVTHTKSKKGVDEITYSYADMLQAIHIVQHDLNITDTTINEAATTIQGSLTKTRAAWKNLLTGLADDHADLDTLIDNFIKSVDSAGKIILPRVKKALNGITKLITSGIQELTPIIVEVLTENMPDIIAAGVTLLTALITGLIQALPQLIEAIPEIIKAIYNALKENAPALKEAGIELLTWIAQGFASMLSKIGEVEVQIITHIVEGLQSAWAQLKEAGVQLLDNIAQGIVSVIDTLRAKGAELVQRLRDGIAEKYSQMITDGKELVEKLKSGISSAWGSVKSWFKGKLDDLSNAIRDLWGTLESLGRQIVEKIKSGISNAWDGLTTWFNNIWDGLFGNRNVNVNVTGTQNAIGLDYVPFNGFPAILHRGEAVLTASEADAWRRGQQNGGQIIINQYIQSTPQTPVELAATTEAYFEQARWAVA